VAGGVEWKLVGRPVRVGRGPAREPIIDAAAAHAVLERELLLRLGQLLSARGEPSKKEKKKKGRIIGERSRGGSVDTESCASAAQFVASKERDVMEDRVRTRRNSE
jgi:hypothetical protein